MALLRRLLYTLALIMGIKLGIISSTNLELEKYLSIKNVPHFCDVIFVEEKIYHIQDFLPSNRTTLVFTSINYTKKLILQVHCSVLVMFGINEHNLKSYDTFVHDNFMRIKLIVIFMSNQDFNLQRMKQYPWNNIWHQHFMVIDMKSGGILYETKYANCALEDPVCALKQRHVKVGFNNVSPFLHVKNWTYYLKNKIQYPTIHLHPNSPPAEFETLLGSEGQLINHLVQEYQMRLTLIAPKDMQYGRLDGMQWTGKMGQLQKNEVDLIVGVVSGNSERRILGRYLAPFDFLKLSLISRKRLQTISVSWLAVFSVFSLPVWVVIFGAFGMVGVWVCSTSKIRRMFVHDFCRHGTNQNFDNHAPVILLLVMLALKQPSVLKSSQGSPTLIFYSWSMCFFILSTIYSSSLTAKLSVPELVKNVETMKDVLDLRKTLLLWRGGTVDVYMNFSNDVSSKAVYENHVRYMDTFSRDKLSPSADALDSNDYVSTADTKFFSYEILAQLDGKKRRLRNYHFSKEPLMVTFCSWIASKHLQISPALMTAMLRAQAFGLYDYWSQQNLKSETGSVNMRRLSNYVSGKRKMDKNSQTTSFTLGSLKGIFFLWLVGISLSLLVFVAELIPLVLHPRTKKMSQTRQFAFKYMK